MSDLKVWASIVAVWIVIVVFIGWSMGLERRKK